MKFVLNEMCIKQNKELFFKVRYIKIILKYHLLVIALLKIILQNSLMLKINCFFTNYQIYII